MFKLVGPVLLKQDVDEAKANVDKRLEFINNELCVARMPARLEFAADCCSCVRRAKVTKKIEQREKDAVEIRTKVRCAACGRPLQLRTWRSPLVLATDLAPAAGDAEAGGRGGPRRRGLALIAPRQRSPLDDMQLSGR